MTTNNPPVAAWAPSTALAKLASRHNNSPCVLTDGPAEFNDVALIRLSDYEILQAECEKLRKDAERYRWMCDGNGYFLEHEMLCGFENEKAEADAAIDAAMETPDAP